MRETADNAGVLWLPALPQRGSVSMDKYWRVLDHEFRKLPDFAKAIRCPLGLPPRISRRAGPARRVVGKIEYVLRVCFGGRCDVVHLLDHSFADLLPFVGTRSRRLATVHDLLPLRDDSDISPRALRRFRAAVRNLGRADRILAVSAYTADEVRRELDVPSARIEVLPMGVDFEMHREAEPSRLFEKREDAFHVLSIGSTLKRKNLAALVPILRSVRRKRAVVLVRVGAPLPVGLRHALEDVLGAGNLVELGRLSDAEVAGVYRKVDALLFTSILEGFGLPLLEAMAAGCPVVSSNSTSLPEVGGEAVGYFDPADTESAAGLLLELVDDLEVRRQHVESGIRRAFEYRWASHIGRLSELYEEASA